MIHDPELLDRLSGLHPTRYEGIVFRATPISIDPIAPPLVAVDGRPGPVAIRPCAFYTRVWCAKGPSPKSPRILPR